MVHHHSVWDAIRYVIIPNFVLKKSLLMHIRTTDR
ncbi:hypothetical protein MSKU15_1866 [Komagataeibacter diospyri]|nr:hypothetical protein MSKU15_1866 [Komagataeibacter diospyri]